MVMEKGEKLNYPIVLRFKNWTPFTLKDFVFFDTTDIYKFRFFKPKSLTNTVSYKDILYDVAHSKVMLRKIRFNSVNIRQMNESYLQLSARNYQGHQYTSAPMITKPQPEQHQQTISERDVAYKLGRLDKLTVSKILPFTTVTILLFTADELPIQK